MIRNIALVRKLLESKLENANPSQEWRDSIAADTTGDAVDTTQHALAREMACRDVNRFAALARHLRAALDRIADGTYGACVHCDQPIPPKRLSAVPWAPLCLPCQEESEFSSTSPRASLYTGKTRNLHAPNC